MQALRFDFRDLFRAPRWAFSLQRIWIQLTGLGVGFSVYVVLTYAAFLLNGSSLADIWLDFGLLPCLFAARGIVAWYSWVVWGAGSLFLSAAILLANTAVARTAYMAAKGNHFYSWREAYSFALRKTVSVLATPFSLLLMIVGIVFLGFLLGLAGRVPLIGPIGAGLSSLLLFVSMLFLIYLIFVCLASFFLTPGIIATTDEDAFEAIFQIFSITWNQPWRWLVYEFINLAVALAAFGVFAWLGKRAVMLTNTLLSVFMGTDYIALSNNGQALVQNWTIAAEDVLQAVFGGFHQAFFFTNEFIYQTGGVILSLASLFYAIGLLFFGGWIVAYGFSTFAMGNTFSYIVLRYKKDGDNLLERRDKEEEDEEKEQSSAEPDQDQPSAST